MKELLQAHWLYGSLLAVGGGGAYRLGHHWVSGTSLLGLKLAGLCGVAIGLFVIARGVSRRAQERDSEPG
jgi:hypothetical protein